MLSMRLLVRGNLPQYAASVQRLHTSTIVLDSSSSSSDSDKESSKKTKTKPVQSEEQKLQARQETNARLNSLLEQMISAPKVSKPIDLAIPPKAPSTRMKRQTYEKKVIEAAKDVATALGGDIKKTESELLNKLLSAENEKADEQTGQPKSSAINLNQLISEMKVDRTSATKTSTPYRVFNKPEQVQALKRNIQALETRKAFSRRPESREQRSNQPLESGNLYGGSLLGIFGSPIVDNKLMKAPQLTTWEALDRKEFRLAVSHPPENVFQELILWTEQGKLWKFPIDNEQGLEEEQNVHFSEHVFMERHLKDWCPNGGPIRHFMELVCVGLSKNPYMKASKKLSHIQWYREFFASKQDLLMEIGAIEKEIPQLKEIEAQ